MVMMSPFLFSVYFLRFSVFSIPFTALEVFTYLLFGMWILNKIINNRPVRPQRRKVFYLMGAVAIVSGALIGALNAPNLIHIPSGIDLEARKMALGIWKGWVFAPFLYFIVLADTLKGKKAVEKLLRMFVYSSALVALTAHIFGVVAEGVTIDTRLRGFYVSANYLALYLVPAALIAIHFFIKRNKEEVPTRYLDLTALLLILYALFFTKSYAGIIGLFGALGLYLITLALKKPAVRKKAGMGIAVLFILFAVVIISQINTPKFKQFLDWENRSSTSVRLEIYRTSVDLIGQSPMLGVGPGLFQAYYQNQAPETLGHAPLEWNMPHPHNVFLGFWLGAGLLGLLGFVSLIVLAHARFTFVLVAFWGMLIHGMFDMPFWKNDLAMIFWLITACILVLQKEKASDVI